MNIFLDNILPNAIYFYNKILKKDYKDISELTSKDCSVLTFKLKSMGMFLVKFIDKDNYEFDTLEYTSSYVLCNQYNKYKKSNMKILILRKMLMLDYDDKSYEEIQEILQKTREKYRVYKTFKGYHAYCVSKEYSSKNYKTLQIMYDLGCDPLYISYTYFFGWCVRLTKKLDREEPFVERFVGSIGTGESLEILLDVLDKKDEFIKNYFIDDI
jgi:hypothetical protein